VKFRISEEPADFSMAWDDFVASAEGATCFLCSKWSSSVARLSETPIHRVMAVDTSGRIIAGVTFAARRRGPIALARKPWATPYCGPVFAADLSSEQRLKVGEAIASHLVESYDYVRIDTGTEFHDLLAFQRKEWSIGVRNTYRIKRGSGPVSSSMEPSARRHTKKRERLSLRVTVSENAAPLFDMYRGLYEGQGKPVSFQRGSFELFCSTLLRGNHARLLYVHDGAEAIAGMLVTRWRDQHFYTLSAFRRERATSAGPTLLIHAYLEDFVAPGEIFDFVGANVETPAINAFKRTFNPQERPYLSLERRGWRYRLCAPAMNSLHITRSVALQAGLILKPALPL
jgi:hypothetical protein